jgi:hypothetical protein
MCAIILFCVTPIEVAVIKQSNPYNRKLKEYLSGEFQK